MSGRVCLASALVRLATTLCLSQAAAWVQAGYSFLRVPRCVAETLDDAGSEAVGGSYGVVVQVLMLSGMSTGEEGAGSVFAAV